MMKSVISALLGAAIATGVMIYIAPEDLSDELRLAQAMSDCPPPATTDQRQVQVLAQSQDTDETASTDVQIAPPSTSASTSYDDLVYQLSTNERDIISEFNRKYLRAIEFSSQEQLNWMIAHGFPTAEMITAAENMTTDQLKSFSATRGGAAQDLYFHRLLDDTIEKREEVLAGGTNAADYDTTVESITARTELRSEARKLLQSDSAFAGYLLHRYYAEYQGDTTAAAAALFLAGQRGDRRAVQTSARRFAVKNNVSDDVLEALGTYAAMMDRAQPSFGTNIPLE